MTRESVNLRRLYFPTYRKSLVDKNTLPSALCLICRACNLSPAHFPRGVVNIFVIFMSILRLSRDDIFFGPAIVRTEEGGWRGDENHRVNKNSR